MSAGDHLQVPRQHGLFNHHGIDLGDGSVAHYLEGREILRSSLEEFTQGVEPCIINHAQESRPGVTLRRAMSRIGEQDYNLLFNNCEHFATWCKTGRHRSSQIDSALERARQWSRLMPSALIKGLELLVRRGIVDETSQDLARQGIDKLERLRVKLLRKLEQILQHASEHETSQLRLTGQSIADELAALDELQLRIDTLLKQANSGPEQEKLLSGSEEDPDRFTSKTDPCTSKKQEHKHLR